ncbi:hypothetical protein M2347_000472 [Chryseobacterium sp. H1D6B]|uniref:DUF2867 domain-containing protein n=1 Tax=Chryseobacterium sp. H1D6B TaxID=2940588 RepID=UPI0015CCD083|nr:DUF2867 domain-containing protein [Chryseobacterium sp. H1D6B]MDH6250745.1 hypothetical protein [Chryseobacterium sp. H1D6B]
MKIPENSLLNNQNFDYADSFEKEFVSRENHINSSELGKLFFSSGSGWIKKLFSFRNKIVKVFGLKTPEDQEKKEVKYEPGDQIGLFKVINKTNNEIIIGEDDKHLNFQVSLLLDNEDSRNHKRKLTITTIVKYNNWWGKLYFFPVKPFHKLIVPSMLNGIIKNLQ